MPRGPYTFTKLIRKDDGVLRYDESMKQKIKAIYENGVLKPLEPLALSDHETVSLTVHRGASPDWQDHDALAWAQVEGDSSVSLEECRKRLSSISGSMSDTIISERGKY